MKRLILLLLVLSINASAQGKDPVQISRIGSDTETIAELIKYPNTDIYYLSYRNTKYKTIVNFKSIKIGSKEDLNVFKSTMINVVKSNTIKTKNYTVMFVRVGSTVRMLVSKSNVVSYMRCLTSDQVNELFNVESD